MNKLQTNTWQSIYDEVLRRIHAREWPPGQVIPTEVDLTVEFGCARATVNRALQTLADAGVLERRRKFGTRVALHPVSRATVDIPIIRQEVETLGESYGYELLSDDKTINLHWQNDTHNGQFRHLRALHCAGGAPYVLENRWISLETVPSAKDQDFSDQSANEWLLTHIPYTHGDISFSALGASGSDAKTLGCNTGSPLFSIERLTWDHDQPVTAVQLLYAPGYEIRTRIGA